MKTEAVFVKTNLILKIFRDIASLLYQRNGLLLIKIKAFFLFASINKEPDQKSLNGLFFNSIGTNKKIAGEYR